MEVSRSFGAPGLGRTTDVSPRTADAVGLAAATAVGLMASGILGTRIVPSPFLVIAHVVFFFTALLIAERVDGARQSHLRLSSRTRRTVVLAALAVLIAIALATLILTGGGLAAASALSGIFDDTHSLAISLALVLPAVVVSRRLILTKRRQPPDMTAQDSERLALIFHELRRPLTTLVSASELAMDADVSETERRQLVETIHRRSLELSGFLEEFIEAVRVQNGTLIINARPTDISAVVSEVVAEFTGPRQTRQIQIVGNGFLMATVDGGKLRIILKNLLSNAISYSPQGSPVTVRYERLGGDLVLEVEDRGAGVPKAYRERIFERYFRVPGTPARGFGLGLYLAQQLVVAHGGTISVADAKPLGARFTILLPVGVDRPAPSLPDSSSSGSSPNAGRQRPATPVRREPLSRPGKVELPEGPAMP